MLAVIAIALFAVLVKANIPSMTTYSFLTSGEGKLATLVIANLPYPLFGLFGHLWGDFYVWTVLPNTNLLKLYKYLHSLIICFRRRHLL